MKLKAYMLLDPRFEEIRTRSIEIPATVGDAKGTDDLLNLAWRYGQNEFQPQDRPSLSAGDVVELLDGSLHRVLMCGWEHLPEGTKVDTLERGQQAALAAFRGSGA